MYNGKKIIGIIPARSGSKGLKDKNIKELNGKPMIAYTIETAIESKMFDDIIVSTDSQEYADISIKYGASVPFLRPKHLSRDETITYEVMVYTLNRLKELGKEYDYLMILQPTSPLRKAEDIIGAVRLLFEKNGTSVISVCEAEYSPLYMNVIDGSLSMSEFLSRDMETRRQVLPVYYRLNGAIYICDINYYLKDGNLYNENSYAYIMDRQRSVDVDDEFDFKLVEYLIGVE